jgi:hypothetical protein
MKKLLIILICLTAKISSAQITLEQTYYAPDNYLEIFRFNDSVTKYVTQNLTSKIITIYNQNHSIYKTIDVTAQIGTNWSSGISYISENLFNTDNLVEFVTYIPGTDPCGNGQNNYKVIIINELGNIIFQRDSVAQQFALSVFNSPQGTKMLLTQRVLCPYQRATSIYSLSGTLFTNIVKNDISGEETLKIYPNPSSNYFKIEYELPKNVDEGIMEIYDMQGQLVKSYRISSQLKDIVLQTEELTSGSYIVNISADNVLVSKKIIKL